MYKLLIAGDEEIMNKLRTTVCALTGTPADSAAVWKCIRDNA